MDFLSKYIFRAAGFLVAAQIFLTFAMTGEGLGGKVLHAGGLALPAIALLAIGGLMTSANGVRAAGFTIVLWAGAGAATFLGSAYGDPNRDRLSFVKLPQTSELSLAFGITNLVIVILAGIAIWVWGVSLEPPPGAYHSVGGRHY